MVKAPLVRFEPCTGYVDDFVDVAESFPTCWNCGWLEDDHLAHVEAPISVPGPWRDERLAS